MPDPQRTVVVIGVGMYGLACAQMLSEHGLSITVIVKGRRPDGRMSTRQADAGLFNHGCQVMAAADERFRYRLEEWHNCCFHAFVRIQKF